jgi:flagellar hook-associated protein 3 FlgL
MKKQEQIQSGSKIQTPSDDPVGAAKALAVQQSKAINEQFAASRQGAKDPLSYAEGILSSVSSLILDVKDQALAAGNATMSDTDRGIIASDLKSKFDQLLAYANSTDAAGNPIFSGFQTGQPAFTKTAGGVVYNGDQGQRMVQVDSSRAIPVNDSGDQIFQAKGNDIFKSLSDLITVISKPVTNDADRATLAAGIASATTSLSASNDTVVTARASIGARLKEIDSLDASGTDRNIQFEQTLADIQGVDLTKAVSELVQQKTTLDAAQQSFVKISGMSLFDYLR